MYYLRTKSAVDAIKFTLSKETKSEPVAERQVAQRAAETLKAKTPVHRPDSVEERAEPYEGQEVKVQVAAAAKQVDTQPMTAEEMRAIIAQAKAAEGDDDCLMCGS